MENILLEIDHSKKNRKDTLAVTITVGNIYQKRKKIY